MFERHSKKLALASSTLLFAALVAYATTGIARAQSSQGTPTILQLLIQLQTAVATLQSDVATLQSSVNAPPMRRFYLTQGAFDGSHALEACADGFHMASLWEILDPSNLRYDTELGFNRADSGSGPPRSTYGWIRSGDSKNDNNCDTWTNTIDEGTAAALFWTIESERRPERFPWDLTNQADCEGAHRVWCVQN